MKHHLFAFVALACATGTVMAGPGYEFEIDNVHSSVTFKVKHKDIHFVYGRFNEVSGVITADNRKKPKKIMVSAAVDAKSVDSNDRARDKDLRKPEFLNIKKFKEISFETKESKKISEEQYELTGELTFLGQTKPLTVMFDITGMGKEKLKYMLAGEATFTIRRSEFGMSEHPDIADEVTVTVSLFAVHTVMPAG